MLHRLRGEVDPPECTDILCSLAALNALDNIGSVSLKILAITYGFGTADHIFLKELILNDLALFSRIVRTYNTVTL